jgi:hypothetical protein
MEATVSKKYKSFCNDTKIAYYLNIIAIILILLFFIRRESPNNSYFSKIIIILLLSACLCINVKSSFSILQWKHMGNIFLNPYYGELKNNILLNLLYCIGLFCFITYLFSSFF